MRYETIKDIHVGRKALVLFHRLWLVHNSVGQITEKDIGKRIYLVNNVVQLESDEQFEKRKQL